MISTTVALALAVSSQAAACSWARPGLNPYRGDPVSALSDYALDDATRTRLRAMMAARKFTDVAVITRDDIAGQDRYDDLRDMHGGQGQLCRGPVDRSAWTAQHEERGLVYCAGDTCVIVPTVCNNVSLVTRRHSAADTPIDVEPAAGAADTGAGAATEAVEAEEGDIVSPALPPVPLPPAIASDDTGPLLAPVIEPWKSCCDGAILAPPQLGPPVVSSPGAGGGSGAIVAPTSAVSEPPAWALVLAGLAACMRGTRMFDHFRRWCAARSGSGRRASIPGAATAAGQLRRVGGRFAFALAWRRHRARFDPARRAMPTANSATRRLNDVDHRRTLPWA